jgi:tryptophan 7-halogenase
MHIRKIVIAGGGLAGWMAASVLARQLPRSACTILVVEAEGSDGSLGTPAHALPVPALSVLPQGRLFHASLGFAEDAILKAAQGCFSLGTAISGWTRAGTPCFHPFGETGAPYSNVSFHHLAARLRAEGIAVHLSNYALAALCAQTERFTRPAKAASSVLSTLDYGLIVETRGYTDMFRQAALKHGVIAQTAHVRSAELNSDGQIDRLMTDQNAFVEGDLFIDCTGTAATLLRACTGGRFEDWSHWLPCSHVAGISIPQDAPPQPYVHKRAHSSGWHVDVPTRGTLFRISTMHSQSSSDLPNGTAAIRAGRQSALWLKNCVALGAAAAQLDPASALDLWLLQSSIRHLASLIPNDKDCRIEAQQYNRIMTAELDCARDFAILPYKINGRAGEPFWEDCRAMAVPDRLSHKIELYKKTGRLALHDGEPFEETDWVTLFDAQNITPQRYDPAANAIPVAELQSFFARVRDVMLRELAHVPFHADYLKSLAL